VERTRRKALLISAAFTAAVIVLAATANRTAAGPHGAAASSSGQVVWGTWAIAVDATPFGIPGGFLPGLTTFHQDGTLIATDGCDIGSFPFSTTDTTQQGVWVRRGEQILATTLFLRKDETTGEIEGWHRIRFTLQFGADGDHLFGLADEDVLECDPGGPTPFKLFNCPDPVTGVYTLSPFAIPIQLTRLRVVS
jgi:hypothetical protein